MGHDMQRRILEGIRADEDSELQMYATEPSGSMSEEGDWPDEVKKGRFTEYCKREGFKGPCVECARKAMKSDDASVRGMATFYMNTVKPGGKTSSDVASKEESVTEKGDPFKYSYPGDEESRVGREYHEKLMGMYAKLKELHDSGKEGTPEWDALIDEINEVDAERAQKMFAYQQDRIHKMTRADLEPEDDDDESPEESVKEDDGWVSLEEMEAECSECADRMRAAGMTKIKRSQVDECKKPPIEESAWRSYGR